MSYPRLLPLLLLTLALPFAAVAQELGEVENVDPWEPLNRKIFAFNEGLDDYLLSPIARGYRWVAPDPLENGVSNAIDNIWEFNTIFNSALQGRPADAFDSFGRLVINSTVGVLGFFDVASAIGIEHKPADFGQTLYEWGVGTGPYLMVPLAGPRTLRSGFGSLVDNFYSIPSLPKDQIFNWTFVGIEAIDIRADLLRADELISGDRYIFVRNAYLQRRQTFLNGGVVIDGFSDFEDGEDFEEF